MRNACRPGRSLACRHLVRVHRVLHSFDQSLKTFKIDLCHPHSINEETEAQELTRVCALLRRIRRRVLHVIHCLWAYHFVGGLCLPKQIVIKFEDYLSLHLFSFPRTRLPRWCVLSTHLSPAVKRFSLSQSLLCVGGNPFLFSRCLLCQFSLKFERRAGRLRVSILIFF